MIPVNLAYGEVSIYNIYGIGIQGIRAPSSHYWGFVDQVSEYGINYTEVGQSVLFKGSSISITLAYNNWSYRIIDETAIIATEQ